MPFPGPFGSTSTFLWPPRVAQPMTPNPAVNRTRRIKPRQAGYLERWASQGAQVLNLQSSKWSELRHAYGNAADIPQLLARLRELPKSEGKAEPWFTLWSALAHQGDVYSASLSAIAAAKGQHELAEAVLEMSTPQIAEEFLEWHFDQ